MGGGGGVGWGVVGGGSHTSISTTGFEADKHEDKSKEMICSVGEEPQIYGVSRTLSV